VGSGLKKSDVREEIDFAGSVPGKTILLAHKPVVLHQPQEGLFISQIR
jgi:hypothetical protein